MSGMTKSDQSNWTSLGGCIKDPDRVYPLVKALNGRMRDIRTVGLLERAFVLPLPDFWIGS